MVQTIADIEIEVDSREPDDTITIIQKLCPKAVRKKLDVGDIVYKNLAFEMKSFSDFISTIKDNRFRNQLYNFLINKDIEAYYIIYGDWTEINRYSNMNINALLGAIASIEARYGVHVLIFPNKEYAIYTICKIIEKSFDHKEVRPTTFKILTNERAIDMICASAEKVGVEDAKRLLNQYGTVRDIVNLSKDDLEKVHKIGEKKANRMIETFTFDFSAKKKFDDEFDIGFDIDNDKIDDADIIDKETEELEKELLPTEKSPNINNTDIQYDHNKDLIYEAISIYTNKLRKPCPLKNIINALKKIGDEQYVKQLLNDLEMESKIYQSKKGFYECF